MPHSHVCVFWTLILFISPVLAEIYKWVDDAGRVHYSDRPHPSGSKTLSLPTAPTPDPDLSERRQKQRRLLDAIEKDRETERQTEAEAQQEQARRRRECARAHDQLRMIDKHGRVYELDETGKRRYWDAQTRDRERDKIADYVRRYCK